MGRFSLKEAELSLEEKIRACLWEAGYPQAEVYTLEDQEPTPWGGNVAVTLEPDLGGVPAFICWKAFRICTRTVSPCFECWNGRMGDACIQGLCLFPSEDKLYERTPARGASIPRFDEGPAWGDGTFGRRLVGDDTGGPGVPD